MGGIESKEKFSQDWKAALTRLLYALGDLSIAALEELRKGKQR